MKKTRIKKDFDLTVKNLRSTVVVLASIVLVRVNFKDERLMN